MEQIDKKKVEKSEKYQVNSTASSEMWKLGEKMCDYQVGNWPIKWCQLYMHESVAA